MSDSDEQPAYTILDAANAVSGFLHHSFSLRALFLRLKGLVKAQSYNQKLWMVTRQ